MTAITEEAPPDNNATPSSDADVHFVVFVHGLWGNPSHLNVLSNSLKAANPKLHVLVAKNNAGNFTYDGIETGGERVTKEIEEELEGMKKNGKDVTKISFVGYSMGGLVARYSIGLLYSKGLLGTDSGKIKPMNFTTFATPHLGTRTPLVGWQNNVWNSVASKTLSASGNQMWLVDNFRDTDRPLLGVMADPESIFMRALAMFERRSLYANIVNDRAVAFYTAYISDIDPYVDLSAVKVLYEPGYEDVIVSPDLAAPKESPATWAEKQSQIWGRMPFYLALTVFAPIGGLVFFGNSAVQSFTSAQRIKQHEEDQAGVGAGTYRFPLMTESMQKKADQALTRLNSAEGQEYSPQKNGTTDAKETNGSAIDPSEKALIRTQGDSGSAFPKLALTKEQTDMKASLDAVGFDKHAVHIKNVNHSHAAIIIRYPRPGFTEGKVVSRHWIERFEP